MSTIARVKRTRTRTGCRTCRVRKVKCDEEFPSCQRCLSSGRVCDGYGLRGGGGGAVMPAGSRHLPRPADRSMFDLAAPQHAFPLFSATTEDRAILDWFKCRTAVKLRGTFFSDFWTSLLFQSSVSEPAILHAVLALSAVHRNGIARQQGLLNADSADSRGLTDVALRHYGQSIKHLQPHFSAKGKLAHKVALITCIVFTSLDFLRGHFKTAFMHIDNGLKLLTSDRYQFNGPQKKPVSPTASQQSRDYVDDWIEETFSRIHLQIGLIRFFHKATAFQPLSSRLGTSCIPVKGPFQSIKQAWQGLEELIGRAIGLSGETWIHLTTSPDRPLKLQTKQLLLFKDVDAWLSSYELSVPILLSGGTVPEQKANAILRSYHSMTAIMAAVSLRPDDEMIFDEHRDKFASLLDHMINLRAACFQNPIPALPRGLSFDMAGSIIDMGCIVPLYYTALKCRDRRLRRDAVEFLEGMYHREGIWDSTMTACIARKIMELEEGRGEDGSPRDLPQDEQQLPSIPIGRRLHDVEVTLVGEPVRTLSMMCRDRGDGDRKRSRKTCVGEFDLVSQTWNDGSQRTDRFP